MMKEKPQMDRFEFIGLMKQLSY